MGNQDIKSGVLCDPVFTQLVVELANDFLAWARRLPIGAPDWTERTRVLVEQPLVGYIIHRLKPRSPKFAKVLRMKVFELVDSGYIPRFIVIPTDNHPAVVNLVRPTTVYF